MQTESKKINKKARSKPGSVRTTTQKKTGKKY